MRNHLNYSNKIIISFKISIRKKNTIKIRFLQPNCNYKLIFFSAFSPYILSLQANISFTLKTFPIHQISQTGSDYSSNTIRPILFRKRKINLKISNRKWLSLALTDSQPETTPNTLQASLARFSVFPLDKKLQSWRGTFVKCHTPSIEDFSMHGGRLVFSSTSYWVVIEISFGIAVQACLCYNNLLAVPAPLFSVAHIWLLPLSIRLITCMLSDFCLFRTLVSIIFLCFKI